MRGPRTIFVGDVQGCARELDDLIRALAFDAAHDRLYLVGDLVRRGPDGAAVLRAARALGARCVLGNHEAHLLERGVLEDGAPDPEAPELAGLPDGPELAAWIRSWPLARLVADRVLCVHAAVPPRYWRARAPEELAPLLRAGAPPRGRPWPEETAFALGARYCDARGRRPPADDPPPGAPYEPWFTFYEGPWTVVFGHWARRGLVRAPRLRGLDTGCVYGGRLSAWILEEDRIVQVPARRRYWPRA